MLMELHLTAMGCRLPYDTRHISP